MRPEEFIADDFANQHATQEVLQAGRDLCSAQHLIERLCKDDLQMLQIIQQPKDFIDRLLSQLIKLSVSLSWLDYLHPSNEQRVLRANKALNDRFGKA